MITGVQERFFVERTRSGRPAMWESGGGMTHTGYAIIIAGQYGEKLKPIFVKRRGQLVGGDHALFVVHPKDHVIIAARHRDEFRIAIYQIKEINEDQAVCSLVYFFDQEGWVNCKEGSAGPDCPAEFEAAVEASKEKTRCYHCRAPHYYVAEDSQLNIQ
jgi:hypothetical protein